MAMREYGTDAILSGYRDHTAASILPTCRLNRRYYSIVSSNVAASLQHTTKYGSNSVAICWVVCLVGWKTSCYANYIVCIAFTVYAYPLIGYQSTLECRKTSVKLHGNTPSYATRLSPKKSFPPTGAPEVVKKGATLSTEHCYV